MKFDNRYRLANGKPRDVGKAGIDASRPSRWLSGVRYFIQVLTAACMFIFFSMHVLIFYEYFTTMYLAV